MRASITAHRGLTLCGQMPKHRPSKTERGIPLWTHAHWQIWMLDASVGFGSGPRQKIGAIIPRTVDHLGATERQSKISVNRLSP